MKLIIDSGAWGQLEFRDKGRDHLSNFIRAGADVIELCSRSFAGQVTDVEEDSVTRLQEWGVVAVSIRVVGLKGLSAG